jgi:transposase-like protein
MRYSDVRFTPRNVQQLTKALVERALDGELTHHLGYEKHDAAGDNFGNSRNGTSPKTLRGKRGQVQIDVPRDRSSEFEPQLVKKNRTRFDGLDEKIASLYSRGMTRARDSRSSGRDLRSRSLTFFDLDRHRRRSR